MHVIQLFTITFGEYSLWSTKYTWPPGATRDSQLSLWRNEKEEDTLFSQLMIMSLTGSVIGSSRLVVWMATSLFLVRVMRCTCSLTISFSNWLTTTSLLLSCAIAADITFSLNINTRSDMKWAVGNIPITKKILTFICCLEFLLQIFLVTGQLNNPCFKLLPLYTIYSSICKLSFWLLYQEI